MRIIFISLLSYAQRVIWYLCFICILDFVIWNLKVIEYLNFYQSLVSN
jgi:hypothetical protein